MKSLASILGLITFQSMIALAGAGELSISLKVNSEAIAKMDLKIVGDLATATVAGEAEQFNLKDMSWLDESTGKWITLAQCQKWAEQTREKTKKSTAAAPAHVRAFVEWSLDPIFKAVKTEESLKLTSGQVDYVIEGEASKTEVDAYFRYALLNAYKKAITEKKLPPFSEVKAIEEMKSLGRIPQKITVAMPGIPGSPVIEMIIAEVRK